MSLSGLGFHIVFANNTDENSGTNLIQIYFYHQGFRVYNYVLYIFTYFKCFRFFVMFPQFWCYFSVN